MTINNSRGFTLVEALLALAILSIGLIFLARFQASTTKGNVDTGKLTAATFLLESRMEQLKSEGFTNLATGSFEDPDNPIDSLGKPGGVFTRTWEISHYLGSPEMLQITVKVAWMVGEANRVVSITTVLSNI